MLKKRIKYVDFDDNEREEEFLFNLTEAEIAEMELSTEGGLAKSMERIVATQDGAKIVETIKALIFKAYGEKSPDGRRFVKSPELSKAFSETMAYSILFMELCTNADAAALFINGIIPQGMVKG